MDEMDEMKGIPMKTWEVRALLANRKTATRRVVAPQPQGRLVPTLPGSCWPVYFAEEGIPRVVRPPYRPGDILYVRETWRVWRAHRYDADAHIEFRAGGEGTILRFPYGCTDSANRDDYDRFIHKWGVREKWHPSIHMPREAARIFLRVTDVRAERLQDSFFKYGNTIFYLQREGIDIGEHCRECIDTYGKTRKVASTKTTRTASSGATRRPCGRRSASLKT